MPQQLPSKEAALFRTVVRNYDEKQYKRGIKNADIILKKHPKHGDTMAMKALIMNQQQKTDEAFALAKIALMNDMKSSICWHVYGLLHRAAKKYEDAIRAYKQALAIDSDSGQILRDLALLQMQTRDSAGYVQTRTTMLQAKSQLIQNWTALAVAHHLNHDLPAAEKVLEMYEGSLKAKPSHKDLEHSEIVMYKNRLIAEQGDYQRALDHLESAAKLNLDRLSVLEKRAEYLAKLDRREEAAEAYRALLHRNPEHPEYYTQLEAVSGLSPSEFKKQVYDEFASKYPRSDAPRRLPLEYLQGDEFKQAAKEYIAHMLKKDVPSTFANLKHLYSDSFKKDTLASLVEEFLASQASEGANGDSSKGGAAALYYLAQHYNYYLSRDLDKALEYVDKAIEKSPKSVEFHMTKARIWKHKGDLNKATEWMDKARNLDVKDRYINTKTAKYQLRNNQTDEALKTMGLFTRADTPGGPFMDLLDMQAIWWLTEEGEAFARKGDEGSALRRLDLVHTIYDTWVEDQFDFHAFSLRKGFIRAYVDMLEWEDRIREHPTYSRAALDAVTIYLKRHERASLVASNGTDGDGEDAAERKKAAKKAAKERQKQEREAAERAAKQDPNKAAPKEGATRQFEDPNGLKLIEGDPLEAAMKFVTPLLEFSPKLILSQFAGFDVYLRRGKYVLALRCLNAARALDASHPGVHQRTVEFKQAVDSVAEPLAPKVKEAVDAEFKGPSGDVSKFNEEYFEKNKANPGAAFAAIKARKTLGQDFAKTEQQLMDLLQLESITFELGGEILELLELWHSKSAATFKARAHEKWPEVTIFA